LGGTARTRTGNCQIICSSSAFAAGRSNWRQGLAREFLNPVTGIQSGIRTRSRRSALPMYSRRHSPAAQITGRRGQTRTAITGLEDRRPDPFGRRARMGRHTKPSRNLVGPSGFEPEFQPSECCVLFRLDEGPRKQAISPVEWYACRELNPNLNVRSVLSSPLDDRRVKNPADPPGFEPP
jgi:hypothetical protein